MAEAMETATHFLPSISVVVGNTGDMCTCAHSQKQDEVDDGPVWHVQGRHEDNQTQNRDQGRMS